MQRSPADRGTISQVFRIGLDHNRGDFNSRIGTKADFLVEDTKDLDFLPEGYELDTFTAHRNNERCLSKQLWRAIDSTLRCIEIKGTKR